MGIPLLDWLFTIDGAPVKGTEDIPLDLRYIFHQQVKFQVKTVRFLINNIIEFRISVAFDKVS